jgi:probable HAF family extracellular repeat protein
MTAAFVRSASLALLSLSILTGCGGSGISSTPPAAQTPPPAPTLTHYTVVDLPPLPGASASQAQGLNSVGDVVGYSVLNAHATAVLWKNGGPTDLGIPNSWANAVNSSDQVAGYYTSASGTPHAALWTNQGFMDLGTLPGMDSSVATGISESGTVVGVSFQFQNSANEQGFTWTSSAGMQPIPGSLTALATSNKQVAGADTANHAAIFLNGQTDDLGTLGDTSISTSVNSSGRAVGISGTHAFFFDGTMRDLGLRDNWNSATATGINDAGLVVGNGLSAGNVSHPYTWSATFGLNDVNTLIPANSGWTIVATFSVNARGQICGLGQMAGALHAVLLNPN